MTTSLLLSALTVAADQTTTFVAPSMVAADGSLDGVTSVVVSDGRITSVTAGDDHAGEGAVRFDQGTVLCPGLIDAFSLLGVYGTNTARADAIDPALSARSALDAIHKHFAAALEAGYTSALLWPSLNNVVAGTTAPVRIGPRRAASPIADDGPLVLVLGSSALESARAPTSRLGAIDLLRRALAEAKAGGGGERLRQFAAGKLPGLVYCESAADVSSALDLFADVERLPVIVHTAEAADVASEVAGRVRDALVLVGPLFPGMAPRVLAGAGELERAGVRVAFGAGLPWSPWDSLRTTAALAARYGMSADAARRAMTINAARAAGLDDTRGSIEVGRTADLVLFSGDPLRADSRVLEVYVEGVRVYDARSFDE